MHISYNNIAILPEGAWRRSRQARTARNHAIWQHDTRQLPADGAGSGTCEGFPYLPGAWELGRLVGVAET
jgi:hypothetical protein